MGCKAWTILAVATLGMGASFLWAGTGADGLVAAGVVPVFAGLMQAAGWLEKKWRAFEKKCDRVEC